MKRRIWNRCARARGGRRAHRGTCRDGRVHIAEARDHADGARARRQGSLELERRRDGRGRDFRADGDAADDESGAGHRARARQARSSRHSTSPEPTFRSRGSSSSQRRGRSPPRHRRHASGARRRSQRGSWCSRRPASRSTFRRFSSRQRALTTALGPAYIQICLASAGVPVGTPGRRYVRREALQRRARHQRRLQRRSRPARGSPSGRRTRRARERANAAGTVAAPAAIAPGAVSLAAKRSGRGATLAGAVTQAGQARGGATVTIFGGRQGNRAQATRQGEGRGERQVRVQGQGRDVLPRRRGRSAAGRQPRCARQIRRCSAASRA